MKRLIILIMLLPVMAWGQDTTKLAYTAPPDTARFNAVLYDNNRIRLLRIVYSYPSDIIVDTNEKLYVVLDSLNVGEYVTILHDLCDTTYYIWIGDMPKPVEYDTTVTITGKTTWNVMKKWEFDDYPPAIKRGKLCPVCWFNHSVRMLLPLDISRREFNPGQVFMQQEFTKPGILNGMLYKCYNGHEWKITIKRK